MPSITRQNWVAEQAGRSVDLEKLRQDPAALARLEQAGVSPDHLVRADRDGDGKVDAGEAWQVADAFDHDGNAQTLLGLDVTGNDTVSARVLAGFGGVFDVAPTRPTVVPCGAERFWDGQHLAFPPAFLASKADGEIVACGPYTPQRLSTASTDDLGSGGAAPLRDWVPRPQADQREQGAPRRRSEQRHSVARRCRSTPGC